MDLVQKKEVAVVLLRWIGVAGHVGGLDNDDYGGATVRMELGSNGIGFADGTEVAWRRLVEN